MERVGRSEQQHALPWDGKGHPHLVVGDREGGCPVLPALDEHVHALAQPDRRLRARILEPADVVDPRAARVHDRACRDTHGFAVHEHVGALPPAQCDHLGVVEDRRARVGGTANVCERQAPVVRHRVRVERAGAERLPAQARNEPPRPLDRDGPVQPGAGERRVDQDPRLHEPGPVRAALVEREQEGQPSDEVRRDDSHQRPPLLVGLADEPHVAEAEVPEAAVDQLGRRRRRAAAEVAPVDERHREPVGRGRLGDAGADDAAADHEQVEAAIAEVGDRAGAALYGQSGFVHAFLPEASASSSRPYSAPHGRSSRTAVIFPSVSRPRISAPCG